MHRWVHKRWNCYFRYSSRNYYLLALVDSVVAQVDSVVAQAGFVVAQAGFAAIQIGLSQRTK
jgi:hypothetical protein